MRGQVSAARLVSKFTILSIDFNDAGQRESFLADYAGKLVWGLPAAMTEFSLTLPSTVRDPRDRCRFVWMPAGAVCVVQGRFFTFSQGRTNYLLLLFRLRYLFIGLLILNETRKSARTNLPKQADLT